MTTTYKECSPGEALDALIRGEKVETFDTRNHDDPGTWVRIDMFDPFTANG